MLFLKRWTHTCNHLTTQNVFEEPAKRCFSILYVFSFQNKPRRSSHVHKTWDTLDEVTEHISIAE